MRERRLRPQAGCQVQLSQSTPVSAAATISAAAKRRGAETSLCFRVTQLVHCALLLHLATRGAAESVRPCGRYSAHTWPPGARGAAGQWDQVYYAVREFHVVRHSH